MVYFQPCCLIRHVYSWDYIISRNSPSLLQIKVCIKEEQKRMLGKQTWQLRCRSKRLNLHLLLPLYTSNGIKLLDLLLQSQRRALLRGRLYRGGGEIFDTDTLSKSQCCLRVDPPLSQFPFHHLHKQARRDLEHVRRACVKKTALVLAYRKMLVDSKM